jgi:hypothetical protein
MKHRNSHFAVGYWNRLRARGGIPDQSDIDPKALKRLLPYVFLLDARHDGAFTYRLAGTALCERFGVELRDHNFLSHWDRESRSTLATFLRQSLRTRTPLCLTSIGATEDCTMVEIETVMMPVTFGGASEPERFLAVANALGDLYPLAGRPIAFERLVAADFIREGGQDAGDPPADGTRTGIAHPRAPYLQLVSSRDKPATPMRRLDMSEALKNLFAEFGARPERQSD